MSTPAEQMTVAFPVSKQGVGLHTGERTAVTLLPAEPDAGIVFVTRSGAEVPATVDSVISTDRSSTLGEGDQRVQSVEHLVAALFAMGVDNVRVEVDGPEVPACDGSAQEWVALLEQVGLWSLGAPRAVRRLSEAVWVGSGDSWAVAVPAGGLSLAAAVDYGDTVVGRQTLWLPLTRERFRRDLAPARTFAFTHELEALRAAGLARGGGEENAFAVGPDGYSGPLRFPDEVVRHKALDVVGDLALCGFPFEAHVFAVRPGHESNLELARKLRAALSVPMDTTVSGEERRA